MSGDLIKPLAGIKKISLVGLRSRPPPKLVSRLVLPGFQGPFIGNVVPPAWTRWILLEAIGKGAASASTTLGLPGGYGADRILKMIPGMYFNGYLYSTNYGSSGQSYRGDSYIQAQIPGMPADRILLYGVGGDSLLTLSDYVRYMSGKQNGGVRLPEYGALNDAAALDPTNYYSTYGCGGGGRLAGQLVHAGFNTGTINYAQGIGGSWARDPTYLQGSAGSAAFCFTFAEEKQQLIDFLNGHYKDGWGVDWRDIPIPASQNLATLNPWLGWHWS